jgi:hypothetical protein
LIRTASDLPTGAVVSLLDYFTLPRATNKPLAQYLMNELARKAPGATPTITEQEAVDVMSKRFLYASAHLPLLLGRRRFSSWLWR